MFTYIYMCCKLIFSAASLGINLKQFPSLKSESMQLSEYTCLVLLPSALLHQMTLYSVCKKERNCVKPWLHGCCNMS